VHVSFATTARGTAGGGLTIQPVFTSAGDVVPISQSATVEVLESPRGLAALSDGQIVVLVLVWLFAFVLPPLGSALAPELHTVLSDSYATFAIALAITWRLADKHK